MRCVDVVLVNWNSGVQAKEAVESILASGSEDVSTISVVDNASTDQSIEVIPMDDRIVVIKNTENVGFGTACNTGTRLGSGELILLLNPDTRVESDTISRAVAFLNSTEGKAYAACGIKLHDENDKVQRHCARIPDLRTLIGEATGLSSLVPRIFPPIIMAEFDHLTSRDVPHVIGAFYMVRRSVFEAVGGFDEDFFVYFEDLDLSKRIQDTGGRIRYRPEIQCFHKGGGTSENIKAQRLAYSMEGRLRFAQKHLPKWQSKIVKVLMITVEPWVRRVHALATLGLCGASEVNKGLKIFRQRRGAQSSANRCTQ
ncbi:MAG: glycosyl transferase [Sphingomonadaceae bacterium PASS1]|nr:MAG: glycosyl transferase [Sphingomonadaceae bacterium PASS1]